jgi:hypothetical protein
MENFFRDRYFGDLAKLSRLRSVLRETIAGRACIVIGSAPDPIVPVIESACHFCVNGSVHSADKYFHVTPDATFLNGAIFNDADSYAEATVGVLRDKRLGIVLVSRNAYHCCSTVLQEIGASAKECYPISKYDKRLIIGEAMGHKWWGAYPIDANVSNGLFMAVVALWAGAKEVILVGFSFNSRHEYTTASQQLSVRGHLLEDSKFLEFIAAGQLPFATTSAEIHEKFGITLRA